MISYQVAQIDSLKKTKADRWKMASGIAIAFCLSLGCTLLIYYLYRSASRQKQQLEVTHASDPSAEIKATPGPILAPSFAPSLTEEVGPNTHEKAKTGLVGALENGVSSSNDVNQSLVNDWLARMNDPQVVNAIRVREKAKIERDYAELLKQLNLSADRRAAFVSLLMDYKMAPTDVAIAMVQKGENPVSQTERYTDLVGNQRVHDDAELQALLGQDAYSMYDNFNRSTAVSGTISRLQKSLAETNSTLSSAQADNLSLLLNATRVGHITNGVMATASVFLTPAQSGALQELYKEQQAMAQIRKLRPLILTGPAR